MDTFFTVLSFPFWFFGIIFISASLFGDMTVGGETNTATARFMGFVGGVVLLVIAWIMA